jgi:hypothetical protein
MKLAVLSACLVTLAACQDPDHQGSPVDGTPDAAPSSTGSSDPVDAAPSPVTVIIAPGDLGSEGVAVFQDPAGGTTVVPTDGGIAASRLAQGGTVTVAWTEPGATQQVVTIFGVAPGDALRLDPVGPDPSSVGDQTVHFDSAVTGAQQYVASFGCNGIAVSDPSQPATLPGPSSDCADVSGRVDVLATAQDASGAVLAYAYAKGAPPAGAAISLTPWSTPGARSVTITDVPAAASELDYELRLVANGLVFAPYPTQVVTALASDPAPFTFLDPPGFADQLEHHLDVTYVVPGQRGKQETIVRETHAGDRTLDLGATVLPHLSGLNVDLGTPARPAITWTAAGAMTGADGGVVRLGWSGTSERTWTLVFPPGTDGAIVAPLLPDAIAPWLPTANDSLQTQEVWFGGSSAVGSYAAFRAGTYFAADRDTRDVPPTTAPFVSRRSRFYYVRE